MDYFNVHDGEMFAEEVALERIAAEVGTPVYVYSQATIERHARVFSEAVVGAGTGTPLVAFAVKANPNGAVLRVLARAGLGADVVSGGELVRAIHAGIPPEKIIFSGVGKSEAEMALALELGVGQINIESEPEAITLSKIARDCAKIARVAFRVNPDVDAGTHAKISTGKSENKFGIAYDKALGAYVMARDLPALEVQGVAVHIGSQLTDLAPLSLAFTKIGRLIHDLRAAGLSITSADLGGGLGVPYDPTMPVPPSPAEYGAMVRAATKGWQTQLIFEPGRLIVANAGVLLSRVVRVKLGASRPFVIVDAAMNDLIRPSMYDAYHDIRAVRPAGARIIAHIVGPVCESGDTFAMERDIDAVSEGDLVVFATAGAYAATMASTYNSRPLTAEVIVSGAHYAIVRPRLDVAALIAAEDVPDWL